MEKSLLNPLRAEPLVSICIPTYNSEKYLKRMLDSIVAQTYKNIEVIISDNASSDATVRIAQNYSRKYGWALFENKENIGAILNMNRLVGLARGDYVAIYHSDDVYSPQIVEASCSKLREYPNVGIVSALGIEIDQQGDVLREFNISQKMLRSDGLYDFEAVFRNILLQYEYFLITPTVMVRREVYRELGVFDSRYPAACDYDMWFRIMQKYLLCIIEENLISYRIHDGQWSYLDIRKNINRPDSLLVYEKYINKGQRNLECEFNHCYYKLLLITAIKLNNQGNFKESIGMLIDIENKTGNFYLAISILKFLNIVKVKVNLNLLIRAKNIYKRLLGYFDT
jgi:glycosyltransferase involved in cell wall biosynthesis